MSSELSGREPGATECAVATAEVEALARSAAALSAEIRRELDDSKALLDVARGPFSRDVFERVMPLSVLSPKGGEGGNSDLRYLAGLRRQAVRLLREALLLNEAAAAARVQLASHRERQEALANLSEHLKALTDRERQWGDEMAGYWRSRRERRAKQDRA